jgi:hypothetical protein
VPVEHDNITDIYDYMRLCGAQHNLIWTKPLRGMGCAKQISAALRHVEKGQGWTGWSADPFRLFVRPSSQGAVLCERMRWLLNVAISLLQRSFP